MLRFIISSVQISDLPFIMYADFECFLENTKNIDPNKKLYVYQKYELYSLGYYFHYNFDQDLCK